MKKTFINYITLLILFVVAFAHAQQQQEVDVLGYENYSPFGNWDEPVYEPYAPADDTFGALMLTGSVPTDQNPNINLVGPDGTLVNTEIDGPETVVEDLLPGVYAVAATDEGLQLATARIEIRAGDMIRVNFDMQPVNEATYAAGAYAAYNTYDVGAYQPYDSPGAGGLSITTNLPDEAEIEVTGARGYMGSFEGDTGLRSLIPGAYHVAITEEGYRITEGVVEVRAGEITQITATLEPL